MEALVIVMVKPSCEETYSKENTEANTEASICRVAQDLPEKDHLIFICIGLGVVNWFPV